MATRQGDADLTKQAILDAATTLFVEKGFAAVALSEISKKAGVTKSLIHHHFGSKEELWQEVKERGISGYFAGQVQLLREERSPVEVLSDSIRLYFRFLQKHPELTRLMTWIAIENDPCASDFDRQASEMGVGMLRRAQELGLIRKDVAPEFLILIFLILSQGWFQSRNHTYCARMGLSQEVADELFLESLLKVYFGGVLAPPAPPQPESAGDEPTAPLPTQPIARPSQAP